MAGVLKKKVIDGTSALKSHGEFLLHQILIRHLQQYAKVMTVEKKRVMTSYFELSRIG